MLIILEGCDGTGKTTLAKLLSRVMDAEIIHCTTQTPNTFSFFESIVYASREKNIIVDRFCYGQYVYQDEFDRPMSYMTLGEFTDNERPVEDSWEALTRLELMMINYGVKLIYVTADTDTIYKRLAFRGETADVEDILAKYEALWKRTLIQPIYFST